MKPRVMIWAIVVAGLVVVDRNAARAANGASDAAVVEAYALSHVDADECAKMIRELFLEDSSAGSTLDVVSDRRTNSLLVAGSSAMQARVLLALADLDVEGAISATPDGHHKSLPRVSQPQRSDLKARVIKLQHFACEELAVRIRVLFRSDDGSEKISWFQPGNSILIRSTGDELDQIEHIISQIDAPPTRSTSDKPEPEPAIFHLEYAKAKDMAEILRSYLKHDRRSGPPTTRAQVIVDQRLNCVVVRGDPLEVAEAIALASRLDIPIQPDDQAQARNIP